MRRWSRGFATGCCRGWWHAAWIIDDTGFPKKGKHSAGVARQAGQLPSRGQPLDREREGKPADCLATLSSRSLRAGSGASAEGENPRQPCLPDQVADRA
ncbi:hypothetical protein EO213_16510 [Paracoccus denitrificans]|nr:hypothetical protein EO213_16510 [Paracoccus denitrificans]